MAKKNRRSKKKSKQIEEAIQGFIVLVALSSYIYTNSLIASGILAGSVFLFIFIIAIWKNQKHRTKLQRSGIRDIDSMDGIQFEHYLRELFVSQGFRAEVTKSAGDFGADLILKKEQRKIVVQAKRYSKNVGIKAVQEVTSAINYYSADEGWVVSNSNFTKAAIELSEKVNVRLINREELINLILKMNPNVVPDTKRILDSVQAKDVICKCGNKMVLRSSTRGIFYGCTSFPKCRNTKKAV